MDFKINSKFVTVFERRKVHKEGNDGMSKSILLPEK